MLSWAWVWEVTSTIRIIRRRFLRQTATGLYIQDIELQNVGATPLQGPISLMLDGLTPGATLRNATHSTVCSPIGKPYLDGPLGSDKTLGRGETLYLRLEFTRRPGTAIAYTPRVFAGPGIR